MSARKGLCLAAALILRSWSTAAEAPPESTLVRGPYLQSLLPTSVDIVWATAGDDRGGRVRYRREGALAAVVEDAAWTCTSPLEGEACHRIRLTGLNPEAEYSYEVLMGDEVLRPGEDFRFRTPPLPGKGVVHFAALGDGGAGTDAQRLVANLVAELGPDGILHTGDLDYLSGSENLRFDESIFGPYAGLLPSMCLFPARGNHDQYLPFEELFMVPGEEAGRERTYYSFDWGAAHVTVLDATLTFEAGEPGAEQLAWLCEDLRQARDSGQPWLVVVTHSPLFTIGPHAVDETHIQDRHLLAPIFDEFGVDLVLSGDDHNYQRSHPLRMRESRGCGSLEPLACEDDPTGCYDVLDDQEGPAYAAPGGTIYVITGGGGQILYPFLTLNPQLDVDTRFANVSVVAFHAVDLNISPAMLTVRAFQIGVGEKTIDEFSISKLRLTRGDVNVDTNVGIADAVATLESLFAGKTVKCLAAGDVHGDGLVNIADPIYLLIHLFSGGPPPAPPYPECGPFPEAATVFCTESGC